MKYRHTVKLAKARRDKALSRPELRDYHNFTASWDKLPDEGLPCRGWASQDGCAPYPLPMPVCRRACKWVNYKSGTPIAVDVIGWHYLKTKEEP